MKLIYFPKRILNFFNKLNKFKLFIHAFFVSAALLAIFFYIYNTLRILKSSSSSLYDKGLVAGHEIADDVSKQISSNFHNLKFFRNAFFEKRSSSLVPDAMATAAFEFFHKTHPSITAINIQDPSGNKIIWSSQKQSSRPIISGKMFQQLKNYPDRFLGIPSFANRDKLWVLPMRERIRTNEGKVIGFIGSPFILSKLAVIRITPLVSAVIITLPDGKTVSVWKNGRWSPPGVSLPHPISVIKIPVRGLPWIVNVQLDNSTLQRLFWRKDKIYLIITLLLLLIILTADIGFQAFYKRIMQLNEYQESALRIQKDLIELKNPQEMYRLVVDTIVKKTNAIGAFVVIPDLQSEWLNVTIVASADERLKSALTKMRISKDPAHFPYGELLPARCYRDKKPLGPQDLNKDPAMAEIRASLPELLKIRSSISYPVFVCNDIEPAAVITILSNDKRHFIQPLQNLLAQMSQSISAALTQFRHSQDLSIKSITDLLTGLPNRRALDEELDRAISRAKRNKTLLAVCMLDLDGFKPINDKYGHEVGDKVLQIIGQRLRKNLRKTDFVARLGGDEFVLLFENINYIENLDSVISKIGDDILAPIDSENENINTINIGLSMGVAVYSLEQDANIDTLLRLADIAMYESKSRKADRSRFWTIYGQQ
jgi:diguanylate cyclase (GGDEF)-like protein